MKLNADPIIPHFLLMSRRLTFYLSKVVLFLMLSLKAEAQLPAIDSSKPNIAFIMVDDGRYDEYRNTGGPEWFIAPAIERIANEGVNFTRTYAPTPICGPSRESIYTGLYAHQHGAETNSSIYDTSLLTIMDILNNEGYYTGIIGKYAAGDNYPTDFDFSFINTQENNYSNITYQFNGVSTFVGGHETDVYNAYIQRFLDSAQVHPPFALFFFPNAPHPPNLPRPVDDHIYDGMPIDLPPNFSPFTTLYPDYYYGWTTTWEKDSADTKQFRINRYECLIGVNMNVQTIFNYLDGHGITDQTMVVYSSDNGYQIGEHLMRAKAYPLETSIHVPLFVRYPPWFEDSTVIENELIELVDIPSTFLDLINAHDTFGFEGYSLHELAGSDTLRRYVRYEIARLNEAAFDVPQIRGLRGFNHLFVSSDCDCYSEELYDLVNDPQENTNQILNPNYDAVAKRFRAVLDSMMLAVDDIIVPVPNHCKLKGAYEIPDLVDNDCDGLVDDSLYAFVKYRDQDGDGFGCSDSSLIAFVTPFGFADNNYDCNDHDGSLYPGKEETCDGIDNDCDGLTDEADPDIVDARIWYADNDLDGYGNVFYPLAACNEPAGYVLTFGDCDDENAVILTGSIEICNGFDDDCNGLTDDDDPGVADQTIFYTDADGDGYGNAFLPVLLCEIRSGYVADATDCNDENPVIFGGSAEICDGIDNNCNGLVDDDDPLITGQTLWYIDVDADGYGNSFLSHLSCNLPFGYVSVGGDCNDLVATVHPGNYDYCDLIDNDCDGSLDEDIVIPVLTTSGPTTFCNGSFITFTAAPVIAGFTYQWYKDGALIGTAHNSTYSTAKSGTYKVRFTGPMGCVTESATISITVLSSPAPTISNTSASNDLCINTPVKLSTKNKAGSTYQWYKGSSLLAGETTNKLNVSIVGNFKVKQTDVNGCFGYSAAFPVIYGCKDFEPDDDEIENPGEFKLFPNPTSGLTNIVIRADEEFSAAAVIEIKNMLGENVFSDDAEFINGEMIAQLNLNSEIAKGVYLITIRSGQVKFYKQLIIN